MILTPYQENFFLQQMVIFIENQNWYVCNSMPASKSQGPSQRRQQRVCKSQRNRESTVRLCFLETSSEKLAPMRPYQHGCLSKSWRRAPPIDRANREGASPWDFNSRLHSFCFSIVTASSCLSSGCLSRKNHRHLLLLWFQVSEELWSWKQKRSSRLLLRLSFFFFLGSMEWLWLWWMS